jgi:hypothetical protein
MDSTAGTTSSRSDSARLPFTLENKSTLPTDEVQSILLDVARGLDTKGVHVIVKNLRRSRDDWYIDGNLELQRLPGWSEGSSGYYRDLDSYPLLDEFPNRDNAPRNASALVVLRVGRDGSVDQRINWLAGVAGHEFTHHYQRLEGRLAKTPGMYLRDPIELEARAAAESGLLPWQLGT